GGQAGEVGCGRHDDAGLTLDRLDQDRGGVKRDGALDRLEVSDRHRAEARRERPEALAIGGLRREPDDGRGAAVEVALGHDDFGAVAADALDPIAEAARCLDRGLDSFRAGVHRQRDVELGDAAELLEERPELVAVIGARRYRQALRLLGERPEYARMAVAVADSRVGAHHVDVALALGVPEISALATSQHDWQRRVVLRAVAILKLDEIHDRYSTRHTW